MLFRKLRINTAQSILEYALLFGVISMALIAMSVYVQRSMNARLKTVQQEFYESSR